MAYQYNWYEAGFLVSFEGRLKVQEIKDAKYIWQKLPRIDNIQYQVWDFSTASLNEVMESDTEDPHVFKKYPEMRVALVVDTAYAKNLADIYLQRAFERGSTWDIKIFDNVDVATSWAQGKDQGATSLEGDLAVPNIPEHVDLAFMRA